MRERSKIAIALTVVFLGVSFFPCECDGGQDLMTGKEWGIWTADRRSVVILTLTDVRKRRVGTGYHTAEGVSLATIAGAFDPSLHRRVLVDFYVGASGTSIKEAPPDGALIVAVAQQNLLKDGSTGLFIVSDWCTFMPDNCSLLVIKNLDDPRIPEILKKIQEARANPNPDPAVRPTTQPGTQPSSD